MQQAYDLLEDLKSDLHISIGWLSGVRWYLVQGRRDLDLPIGLVKMRTVILGVPASRAVGRYGFLPRSNHTGGLNMILVAVELNQAGTEGKVYS